MKLNINNKYYIIILSVIAIIWVLFLLMNKDSSKVLNEEFDMIEERITQNREARQQALEEQQKIYKAWQARDKEFHELIEADKKRLEALSVLIDRKPNIEMIPKASASQRESETEWPSSNSEVTENNVNNYLTNLHNEVCRRQPKSPLCNDKELLIRLYHITEERVPGKIYSLCYYEWQIQRVVSEQTLHHMNDALFIITGDELNGVRQMIDYLFETNQYLKRIDVGYILLIQLKTTGLLKLIVLNSDMLVV